MRRAVYPGTFDPITFGHLDVIKRGSALFEELVVAVSEHPEKQPLLTLEERAEMVRQATAQYPNVRVETFTGLAVEFLRSQDMQVILRGIRTVSDFEYESQMALTNRHLAPDIETVFVMSDPHYAHLSSQLIREVVARGGDVSAFVPVYVARVLSERLKQM
jgi:pantetheine-phosphate adenylyltransferase